HSHYSALRLLVGKESLDRVCRDVSRQQKKANSNQPTCCFLQCVCIVTSSLCLNSPKQDTSRRSLNQGVDTKTDQRDTPGSGPAEKLRQEPITEHDPRRQPPEKEKKYWHHREHAGTRIKKKICAHHSRNRSARPHTGDSRIGIQQNVRDRRCHTTQQIKNQIT